MFIAPDPRQFIGQVIGNGHCVAFVRLAANLPATATWRRGTPLQVASPTGLAIATFSQAGRYTNATDGSSHAAILLSVLSDGLLVIDQWVGQPVHERTIRFRDGRGPAANDGRRFFAITLESTRPTTQEESV